MKRSLQSRVGMYAWAGPGTIRLLQTKYFNPEIDTDSILHGYSASYLKKIQKLFAVSDAWVTFSWGFSDKTEQEDYLFLRKKLVTFRKLHIRTHLYVQGLNLVTTEWKNVDPWCKDPWGKLIPYSKGRSFICPNNPIALKIICSRVKKAAQENGDGVFVDNILFGIPPFYVYSDILPFCGCSCTFCQEKFYEQYGYPLPLRTKRGKEIKDYLVFREQTITRLVKKLARIAHSYQKEFGINLYDPVLRLDTLYYGYSLKKILPLLDYLLIENHALAKRAHSGNGHLHQLIQETKKPVFIVSYDKGIGEEENFSQQSINQIFSEAQNLHFSPCLKVTEFTTRGIWHMLHLSELTRPEKTTSLPRNEQIFQGNTAAHSSRIMRILLPLLEHLSLLILHLIQENRIVFTLLHKSGVLRRAIQQSRSTSLE